MARIPHQFAVVASLCSLLFITCAADQTTESLVISKSDDATDNIQTTVAPEPVTEEHTPPIKLTEMDVKSYISMRYAHTAVVAHVRNPAKKAQEANFRVLLPETAFISGFVMNINGKSYKAYVKEKEEAKQIYNAAVSQGIGAAHIAAKVRDSNHFTVSVNVEPSSLAIFNLTYEELLPRRNGVYNHAINLHPGALVPKFTVTVNIMESANITELRVPEIRTGNEIDATKEDPALSNAIVSRNGPTAVISFAPDLDEQQRLMAVYQEKSKKSNSEEGILGQFVVQYDVDRPNNGEVLVNDGYFVHFFAPSDLPPLNKYVVFVLDTSGSMMGRKMEQLQTAMQTILNELNPGDYFSIVDFDSSVSVHHLAEAAQEPAKHSYYYSQSHAPTLIAPSPATKENIDKARVIIQRLEAYGGTNIDSALNVAVDLINKRAELLGQNSNVTTAAPDTTEVAKATKDNEEGGATLEPMIIFLTDGDPTVGDTNTNAIINHITEKNYGLNKAAIFSLAFGEDADRKFLRKLALRNDGFMRHIYEASDAALQLRDFYRQVSSPVVADVKFVYPPDQVKESTLTKSKFRAFYAGSEMVVAGELADSATELEPQTLGFCGVLNDGARKKYDKKIRVPVNKNTSYLPLERLWAYLSIKQLLDESDASDASEEERKKEDSPEKKALALALRYEFVTPLTSLVVVKPNETSAVDAESVDKIESQGLMGAFGPAGVQNSYIQPLHVFARPMVPHYQSALSSFISPPGSPSYDYGPHFKKTFVADYVDSGPTTFSLQSNSPSLHHNTISGDIALDARSSFSHHSHRHRGSNYPMSGFSASRLVTHQYPQGLSGSSSHGFASRYPSGSHYSMSSSSGSRFGSHHYPSSQGFSSSSHGFASSYSSGGSGTWSNRFDGSSTTEEAEETDSDALIISSTPLLETRIVYGLQDYPWTEGLLNYNNDTLAFQTDVTVILKVTRGDTAPKASGSDAECSSAIGGGNGLCVYLTRCHEARTISLDTYKNTYCSVEGGYAGVCCSTDEIKK